MYHRLRGKALVYAIGFCCGNGYLLLGYDSGVMGGVVGYAGNTFAQVFNNPSPLITGVMVSVYEAGCVFGALAVLFYGETFGRRRALLFGGAVVVVGTILQATSFTRAQFIFARVFTGIGNGINTSTLGVYQSELCTPRSRGKLVTAEGIMALAGVMISYWLDFGMSYTNSSAQWRFPIAFQAAFAIGMAATAFILPETPRWLVAHGRDDEAKLVIAALADTSVEDSSVAELHSAIRETVDYELAIESESSWRELFGGGELQNFRRVCLCFGIQFMEEMGGINMINVYLSFIFLSIGTSHFLSLLLAGVDSTTFFLSALIPIWLVDRVGRKPLLIYGSIGMTCTMIMLAVSLSLPGHASGIISVLSIFLFQVFYSTGGWMATPFLYPPEISTLRLRSKSAAISLLSKWIFNFLVVMIAPVAVATIGWRVYVMWAVFNFTFIFVVYFFYPETKGLTLEETDRVFEGGDPITRGAIGFGRKRVDWRPYNEASEKADETNDVYVEKL